MAKNVKQANAIADNIKLEQAAKLLGLEIELHNGLYTVYDTAGKYIGEMSATAWLDHIRYCMANVRRT